MIVIMAMHRPVGDERAQEAIEAIAGVTDGPVLQMLLRGEAMTLYEAEEKYLDASLTEIVRLAGTSMSNEELADHPLYKLLLAHGSRGWEDSLL